MSRKEFERRRDNRKNDDPGESFLEEISLDEAKSIRSSPSVDSEVLKYTNLEQVNIDLKYIKFWER
ncbi:MAG: hypothetical protein AAGF07_01450 [Patescibacteria group bacterium]